MKGVHRQVIRGMGPFIADSPRPLRIRDQRRQTQMKTDRLPEVHERTTRGDCGAAINPLSSEAPQ